MRRNIRDVFCRAMLESDVNSRYADTIERVFYNGVLSGISLDGKRFFYVNPLEINLNRERQTSSSSELFVSLASIAIAV